MAAPAEEPVSTNIDAPHRSAAHSPENVAAPIGAQAAARALENGPFGALWLGAISVGGLLFIGWLLFYFLLYLPRGPIG